MGPTGRSGGAPVPERPLRLLAEPTKAGLRRAIALLCGAAGKGRLDSCLQTHWLAAGALWRSERDAAKALLAHLGSRLDAVGPSGLGWLAHSLSAAGVPASQPVLRDALGLLARSQAADGDWRSEDGPTQQDVEATLTAIHVLRGRA